MWVIWMSVIRTYHDGLVDRWNATVRRTAGANDDSDNDNDSAAMLVAIPVQKLSRELADRSEAPEAEAATLQRSIGVRDRLVAHVLWLAQLSLRSLSHARASSSPRHRLPG